MSQDDSSANKKLLIVNADDFGMSEQVNDAVIRAFKEGVLTSCSLMVTGEAFDHAVALARENPRLAVGIHLVTVMGRSVLPRSKIPSLVDDDGNFSNYPVAAGLRYFFSARARRDLKKELIAQFEKFRDTGLQLSHIDGHLHLHVHPVIFRIALELGRRYGAPRMRVPEDDRKLALGFDRTHVSAKTALAILFQLLARYMKPKLRKSGFAFAERVYGNLQSGRMNEEYFLYVLNHLRAGTNEIYFHPAQYEDESKLNGAERQCAVELAALMSARVKQRLAEPGVELASYFDLVPV